MFCETTFLDMSNNPFIDWSSRGVVQNPTTWNTDEVACAKVLLKLRREIAKAEFKLSHPPLMYSNQQRLAWRNRLETDIAYWTSRLSEARYN